ncbi:UDP-glycosyltransferase [Morus notabilis]|uniref:Glycosyltransferase n=1 Tax=Morus notabilis TaxID=981085 RepID=W9R320_9ROSA|nr:UDP-glycosyltransferase [Morus notabilis]
MEADDSSLHIAMYPWFAFGHITPFLHLSNKLAKRGHKISFFVPTRTQSKIEHFNHFPHLITFAPITVPHIDGLPLGAETTYDVPNPLLFPLIIMAMEKTKLQIELLLRNLKPDIIFFDFAHWIPNLARPLGIKSVFYSIISPVSIGYGVARENVQKKEAEISEQTFLHPPPDFPDSSSMNLHLHETKFFAANSKPPQFDGGTRTSLFRRIYTSMMESDALAFKAFMPEPPVSTSLEEKWANFLGGFKAGSGIYCALGSEWTLTKEQFQELLLGFELSGLPFLAALKPPYGAEKIEEALPEGFGERIRGRGVVHGGWIQQRLILEHPCVGCFVTHCGSGSLMEGLLSKSQLVMIPHVGDHCFRARLIGNIFKAGVEVERAEEDGFFTKESVCKAIKTVMEEENYYCDKDQSHLQPCQVAREIRANHAQLRELLSLKDLESSYIDDFSKKLQLLL